MSNQARCVAGKVCGILQSVNLESSEFDVFLTLHCDTPCNKKQQNAQFLH